MSALITWYKGMYAYAVFIGDGTIPNYPGFNSNVLELAEFLSKNADRVCVHIIGMRGGYWEWAR